jgi:hypothetical protein
MRRPAGSIVGRAVPDQTLLRARSRVSDVKQFVDFLAHLDEVFGRLQRPRRLTTGRRFLL